MCSIRRYRTLIKITAAAISFLLIVKFLTQNNSSTSRHPKHSHFPLNSKDQSYTTEQVTYPISDAEERTPSVTTAPRKAASQEYAENLHVQNYRHRSTGEFHKVATTEATVLINKANTEKVPEKLKRGVTKIIGKLPETAKELGPNMTLFFEESPDVKAVLPKKFLPDYRSFCWYSPDAELLCLPSVYIIGIPKCGTSDIFKKLTWHPQLAVPGYGKEHAYWNRRRLGRPLAFDSYEVDEKQYFKDYLKAFNISKVSDAHNAMFVDGTPSLAWDLVGWETRYPGHNKPPYNNANLLHTVSPGAKVILMLRDPVRRLYSDYVYFKAGRSTEEQMMRTPLSFHDEVYIEMRRFRGCLERESLSNCCHSSKNSFRLRLHLGVYVCYVKEWKEMFSDNLLVLTLEEYSKEPIATLLKLFTFLGIDKPDESQLETLITESAVVNSNRSNKLKMGEAVDATVSLLKEFYGPYNRELALLLDDPKFNFGWESWT